MNIESRTDHAQGFRTHTVRGAIQLTEIRDFLGEFYRSGEFDPALHAVWDMREASFSEVAPADIRDLAYFVRVNWAEKHSRKTAVIISVDFHFGLSRMLEQFIGHAAVGRFRTFRELPAAVAWIEGKGGTAPASVAAVP